MARTDTLGHFLTDVADSIRTKKQTTNAITASDFDTEILSIPSGPTPEPEEKDVNFYDYDGTRLYSYTKTDFNNLEEMPENPTHSWLTSTGWNMTLESAKYYSERGKLDIGQQYETLHHGMNIYIYIDKYLKKNVVLTLTTTAGATVDWGDETTTTQGAGTGTTYIHNYSQEGNYCITVTPATGGEITIAQNFVDETHKVKVKRLELGNTLNLSGTKVFNDFAWLENITLPAKINIISNLHTNLFDSCGMLKCITLPKGMQYTAEYMFSGCRSIKHIMFPDSIVTSSTLSNYIFTTCPAIDNIIIPNLATIGSYAFRYCYNITELYIPYYVRSISANAFNNMKTIKAFYFTGHSSVPSLSNTNAFNNITDYKIVVPDDLYQTWINSSTWNSLISKIIKASDYTP